MNRVEALVDRLDPRVSVRLRWLKQRLRRDPLLHIMRALVHRGDVAIDVGANRGVYTLALSRSVGASGHVHCFDPVPVNRRSLEGIERSRHNVTVHAMALSDTTGSADLHVPVRGGRPIDALARLGAPLAGDHETQRVSVGTLDEIFAADAARPAFVKCDVEGHEHHVLRGGHRLLAHQLPTLVIEIEQRHRDDDMTRTIDELLSWGYEGYGIGSRALRPVAEFDVVRDQLRFLEEGVVVRDALDGEYLGNFLFVRPDLDLGRLLLG